jgi:bacterioferritin-associated ferredoxin
MYVCVCNAISDRDVRTQAEAKYCTVSMIYRSLGTKPKCGKCVPLVCQLLRQVVEAAQTEPIATAAAA